MRFFLFVIVVTAVTATAGLAETFRAVNRLYVVPVTPDTFEVIEDRGAGARGIWCAAADYVRTIGRDSTRKRMFVLEARGPSRTVPNRIGVLFTLTPDESIRETPSSYSVTVNRKGENLAVGHAYNFCQSLIEEFFDRF